MRDFAFTSSAILLLAVFFAASGVDAAEFSSSAAKPASASSAPSAPPAAPKGTLVAEKDFEVRLPVGWSRIADPPKGFVAGFTKKLSGKTPAFVLLNYVPAAPQMLKMKPDRDSVDAQADAVTGKIYPGATVIGSSSLSVAGNLFANRTYTICSAEGQKLNYRFTYFFTQNVAVTLGSTAPAEEWDSVIAEMDQIATSLKFKSVEFKKLTDAEAATEMKRRLSNYVRMYPPDWTASLEDVAILTVSSERTVAITIKWKRDDLRTLLRGMKAVSEALAAEKEPPADALKGITPAVAGKFSYLIGQACGNAYSVAFDCEQPVKRFQVILLEAGGQRIGTASVLAADLRDAVAGKITDKRAAAMIKYEEEPPAGDKKPAAAP